MLEYEWGNASSSVIISGADDQLTQDSDHHHHHHRQELFHNYQNLPNHNFMPHHTHSQNTFSNHHFLSPQQQQYVEQDAYNTPYQHPVAPSQMLGLDPNGGGQFLISPKSEEMIGHSSSRDFNARIGLNLGHRTYFSSEDDFVNRLYRRSRSGMMDSSGPVNTVRCQAEGCVSDLTHAKHYHRRHKVCEFHSKASTVIAAGVTQRFCQQCSRFHLLPEFDNGKRSCRKRLADHNRRRRKSQQQPAQDQHQIKSPHPENGCSKSSSETLTRSPADSGTHSLSSVTVAVSPPRMSLDCFRQRSYNGTMSSGSSNLLFYSNE